MHSSRCMPCHTRQAGNAQLQLFRTGQACRPILLSRPSWCALAMKTCHSCQLSQASRMASFTRRSIQVAKYFILQIPRSCSFVVHRLLLMRQRPMATASCGECWPHQSITRAAVLSLPFRLDFLEVFARRCLCCCLDA